MEMKQTQKCGPSDTTGGEMTIERDVKMMHQSEGSMRYAWLGDRNSKNMIQTEVEGESYDI